MLRNAYFYYIKSTFFDIITYYFKSYDSRKTNNTSFECPSRWFQNTRRTALNLFQGLSRNLSFKKCIFYKKGCVTVPNRGTQLSLRYFNATSRAKKWGIICSCGSSVSHSNCLQSKKWKWAYHQLRYRVYLKFW